MMVIFYHWKRSWGSVLRASWALCFVIVLGFQMLRRQTTGHQPSSIFTVSSGAPDFFFWRFFIPSCAFMSLEQIWARKYQLAFSVVLLGAAGMEACLCLGLPYGMIVSLFLFFSFFRDTSVIRKIYSRLLCVFRIILYFSVLTAVCLQNTFCWSDQCHPNLKCYSDLCGVIRKSLTCLGQCLLLWPVWLL